METIAKEMCDIDRFFEMFEKGNMRAGQLARKKCQEVKRLLTQFRNDIMTETKKRQLERKQKKEEAQKELVKLEIDINLEKSIEAPVTVQVPVPRSESKKEKKLKVKPVEPLIVAEKVVLEMLEPIKLKKRKKHREECSTCVI